MQRHFNGSIYPMLPNAQIFMITTSLLLFLLPCFFHWVIWGEWGGLCLYLPQFISNERGILGLIVEIHARRTVLSHFTKRNPFPVVALSYVCSSGQNSVCVTLSHILGLFCFNDVSTYTHINAKVRVFSCLLPVYSSQPSSSLFTLFSSFVYPLLVLCLSSSRPLFTLFSSFVYPLLDFCLSSYWPLFILFLTFVYHLIDLCLSSSYPIVFNILSFVCRLVLCFSSCILFSSSCSLFLNFLSFVYGLLVPTLFRLSMITC